MTRAATSQRKLDHIRVASRPEADRNRRHFDRLRLQHRALPELDRAEIDPGIEFMGRKLAFPLLISSMTGGAQAELKAINRNLARAAEAAGVGLGVGSQRVMFQDRAARASFELRRYAPGTLLLANLGAVQLNHGFTIDHCREAVQVLAADGLYLHLNPLQEAVQPEGEPRFAGLAQKIGDVAAALDRPVIVKEVGCGISRPDAELLVRHGIRYLDVAGAGGTSWGTIEHLRQPRRRAGDLPFAFDDWGGPTPDLLLDLAPLRPGVTLIGSGGLRSGVDMAKAMILGASLCGLARPFLAPARESADAVLRLIAQLKQEFVTTLFLLGVARATDLVGRTDLLAGASAAP